MGAWSGSTIYSHAGGGAGGEQGAGTNGGYNSPSVHATGGVGNGGYYGGGAGGTGPVSGGNGTNIDASTGSGGGGGGTGFTAANADTMEEGEVLLPIPDMQLDKEDRVF